MPLTQEAIAAKIKSGKPFIVGTFLGMEPSEQMCKTKGNPNVKENRVILKHMVRNKNGIHVFSEFLPPGSTVEKDKTGEITKVTDDKGVVRASSMKVGQEVCVDLFAFERDGVGMKIMGEVTPI